MKTFKETGLEISKQKNPESGINPEQENLEIEKKFLIEKLPENLEEFPQKEIKQGYTTIAEDGTEIRIRKEQKNGEEKYYQQTKSGGGEVRFESSKTELPKEVFNSLWEVKIGQGIEKTRYKIPYEYQDKQGAEKEAIIDLDVFKNDLEGHLTVEMEFESEEDSKNFVPPDWFGEELTGDERYKNQSLALNGLPERKKDQENITSLQEDKENLDIPRYELEEGVKELIAEIEEKISQTEGTIIVEVAGGSASGKTSKVAEQVKEKFGDNAIIFSMDNYYRGGNYTRENDLNFDQPEAIDIDLYQKHLQQLKKGESIPELKYDFGDNPPETIGELQPQKIIIVEGLFALHDDLEEIGDVKTFVDIGTHGRMIRRLLRDVVERGQKPDDIIEYFAEIVEPMHEKYIEDTKKNADFIINNEYNPEIEAERSGMYEVQMKFKGSIDNEALRKIGAEKLSFAKQTDYYYNPKDRDLAETEEILRIREEGEDTILTYKGPKDLKSEFRERPKFEFKINREIKDKFLPFYGNEIKVIKKSRTLYQLDGIVFSLDSVSKIENGEEVEIGDFIEVRTTDKESKEKMDEVILKLGLKKENGTKKAYVEM